MPAPSMPCPPQDGGSQTDGRPATDGESRRRVCVHAPQGLHTRHVAPYSHSAKGMHAVYVSLCQACHARIAAISNITLYARK